MYLPVHPHSLIWKQARITSKYHNHRPQTHPQHYVEEAQNNTVNPEIFARVLFSRTFAYAHKFRENKIVAKSHNHSVVSYINIGKSCPSREFLASRICLLALFAKIEFSRKFRIYSSCHTTAVAQLEISSYIFFSQIIAKVDSTLQNNDLILCLRS